MPEPTVAICALAKDESLYVEEWIAFHLLQGIGEILIFDNSSSDGMREILNGLKSRVPVSVVDWPGDDYYNIQMGAYSEGAKRLAGRADWVAFIDIDEFLFSSHYSPLPVELAEFGSNVGAVAVGHRIFGSSGFTSFESGLVTSRFTSVGIGSRSINISAAA